MRKEIERKFLVKYLPDISNIVPIQSERYFIKNCHGIEERAVKLDNKFFHIKKWHKSDIERTSEKIEISKDIFESLVLKAYGSTCRDTYQISKNPKIYLHVYKKEFSKLVKVEVEFDSAKSAMVFEPLPWMGNEITGTNMDRDSDMIG